MSKKALFIFISITIFIAINDIHLKNFPIISKTIAETLNEKKLSLSERKAIAKVITVKVHVGEYRASGILIAKKDNTYTVVTNAHVTERDNNYSIETADGIKHTATLISKDRTDTGNDLAVLQFNSDKNYQVAKVGNSNNLTPGESVTAAGFPYVVKKNLQNASKI